MDQKGMDTGITTINRYKKADPRCKECISKSYGKMLMKIPFTHDKASEFNRFMESLLSSEAMGAAPHIHRELHQKLRVLNSIADPYKEEKKTSNRIALRFYKYWKPRVLAADDPFNLALRLAIAGNIMDFAVADRRFDLEETISYALAANLSIDHSSLLKERIRKAERVLYLGDNAGEIVFDKLFIETMLHPDVTYAVRGGPAINDALMDDAVEVGMDIAATVISNGYDASSTLLTHCSPEFLTEFKRADLIISKGQGNLEGLIETNDSRIFFLFMVKCDVVAEIIGVEKGSLVVYNPNHI